MLRLRQVKVEFCRIGSELNFREAAVLFTEETEGAPVIASKSWPVLAAIPSLLAKFNAMTLRFSEPTSSLDLVLQEYHQLQFDLNQTLEQARHPI